MSEMSYTWPVVGIHETVKYWNVIQMTCTWNCQVLKCHVHDLYMKLSGIEISYTWPIAGIHETVRYQNVIYMTGIVGIHETVRYILCKTQIVISTSHLLSEFQMSILFIEAWHLSIFLTSKYSRSHLLSLSPGKRGMANSSFIQTKVEVIRIVNFKTKYSINSNFSPLSIVFWMDGFAAVSSEWRVMIFWHCPKWKPGLHRNNHPSVKIPKIHFSVAYLHQHCHVWSTELLGSY